MAPRSSLEASHVSRLDSLMELQRADPEDSDLDYMIASELVSAGRTVDAVTWLERHVARGPDVGAGWSLLADCHVLLGNVSAARHSLEQGIPAALRSGHPTLASELRDRLENLEPK